MKTIEDFGIKGTGEESAAVEDKVLNMAAKFLSYKMRTRKQLTDRLRQRGCSPDQAEACADLMESYHLLDDREYARVYIESRLESGRGMARIRQELHQAGIDENMIEDALAEIEEIPDEYELALKQAQLAVEGLDLSEMDYQEKQKARARIARRLAGRGFRTDVIYRAVGEAFRPVE